MRARREWGPVRTAAWLGVAFAAGCVPSGRIVTRVLTGKSLDDLGDGKPGSANVGRSVGWAPGAAVLAMDAGKAFVPAAAARLAGAPDGTVAALGITAMAGHITVVGGRGAACALGAAFAMDAPMMTIALVPLVGVSLLHRHPQAVAVTAVSLPFIRLGLRRRLAPALWPLLLISILIGARLKGSRGAGWPSSPEVWWNRFWLDRDE
jgi:glycerol-3-phosphate acyltransferase PlsY